MFLITLKKWGSLFCKQLIKISSYSRPLLYEVPVRLEIGNNLALLYGLFDVFLIKLDIPLEGLRVKLFWGLDSELGSCFFNDVRRKLVFHT